MTDFQKELINELKEYVLSYMSMAANLLDQTNKLTYVLDDESLSQDYKQDLIDRVADYRQAWLEANNVFQTLYDEREAWKALITSFEEEES